MCWGERLYGPEAGGLKPPRSSFPRDVSSRMLRSRLPQVQVCSIKLNLNINLERAQEREKIWEQNPQLEQRRRVRSAIRATDGRGERLERGLESVANYRHTFLFFPRN